MQTLPGRPPPTTFESIESIALATPRSTAVVEGRQAWDYEHLYLNLVRLTRLLDSLGVRRGQRVAVSRPGFYLQLMLLLACENLGAVTVAFQGEADPDVQALCALVDWVLSERVQPCPPATRFVLLDDAFFARAAAIDPREPAAYPRVSRALHEPQRLARTSGSTGRSRFMEISRAAQENIVTSPVVAGYTSDAKLLLGSPLVLNSAYARCCLCLSIGASVMACSGAELDNVPLTHVWALPMRLEEILDELPAGFARREGVTVVTLGGALPPRLRERTLQAFGGPIRNAYGANETGTVCDDLDATAAGQLRAGADIRIVDEAGRDLPAGQWGVVVVRTPSMAQGYLGEPEATALAFRDGWFHSGDYGALVGPRRLQLAGRLDDLLNVGGIKVPAARIEDSIRTGAQVRDVAVLSVHADGAGTLGIAVVAMPGVARDAITSAVQAAVPGLATVGARIVFLDVLPRMASGKLDRLALARRFRS